MKKIKVLVIGLVLSVAGAVYAASGTGTVPASENASCCSHAGCCSGDSCPMGGACCSAHAK